MNSTYALALMDLQLRQVRQQQAAREAVADVLRLAERQAELLRALDDARERGDQAAWQAAIDAINQLNASAR